MRYFSFLLPIKYNKNMEIDMDKKHWQSGNPCPEYDCRKNSCSKCKCGIKNVNIPASLGDDSEKSSVAPKNGEYCNAIVKYESNGNVYFYSAEGIPTKIYNGAKESEEGIHLKIANLEASTWTNAGSSNYISLSPDKRQIYVTCVSNDATFATDDNDIMTISNLYAAIKRGERITLDIPFEEIVKNTVEWSETPVIFTALDAEFSHQETFYRDGEGAISSYTSTTTVGTFQQGNKFVYYSLPFGVNKIFRVGGTPDEERYEFFVTGIGNTIGT